MTTSKTLLAKALLDIDAAKMVLPKANLHSKAGEFLHQAAEKTLKAILIFNEMPFSKDVTEGHDLKEIINRVSTLEVMDIKPYAKLVELNIYDHNERNDVFSDIIIMELKPMLLLCEKLLDEAGKILKITPGTR